MDIGAEAKMQKLNPVLKRSRRDLKGQYLKFRLWDVKSFLSELKLLSVPYQPSARKVSHIKRWSRQFVSDAKHALDKKQDAVWMQIPNKKSISRLLEH
ncbi:hypothetical protein ACTXT7_007843 [Hymenolepis weldensis]